MTYDIIQNFPMILIDVLVFIPQKPPKQRNPYGIETVILGTGMQHVHSSSEQVKVADMAHVAQLLVEIIRLA